MKRTAILVIVLFLLVATGGVLLYYGLSLRQPEDSMVGEHSAIEDIRESEDFLPGEPEPEGTPPPTVLIYQTITATEALEMMESGEPFVLLDVRALSEFEEMHIAGAILIPGQELAVRTPAELPDQDVRILVYCRSGRRSADAARILLELGYTNVYDMGGILDWPYEVVR